MTAKPVFPLPAGHLVGGQLIEGAVPVLRRDWYCEDVLSEKVQVDRTWEDDLVLAFHHPDPQSETHAVVIPKKHISSILDAAATDGSLLSSMVSAVQKTALKLGLDKTGFYVRVNAASEGVTPHMHWHILGPGTP